MKIWLAVSCTYPFDEEEPPFYIEMADDLDWLSADVMGDGLWSVDPDDDPDFLFVWRKAKERINQLLLGHMGNGETDVCVTKSNALVAVGPWDAGLVNPTDEEVVEMYHAMVERAWPDKCDLCGRNIVGPKWHNYASEWTGFEFCSEYCAERDQEILDELAAEEAAEDEEE